MGYTVFPRKILICGKLFREIIKEAFDNYSNSKILILKWGNSLSLL